MENGRMQCLFPAEIEALRADRYFLNYTGKGIKTVSYTHLRAHET